MGGLYADRPAAWARDRIHGVGGFHAYETYEVAAFSDRDVAIVEFTLRCLANPKCDGSGEVLNLLDDRRQTILENPAARAEALSDRHERLHNRDGKVEGVDR